MTYYKMESTKLKKLKTENINTTSGLAYATQLVDLTDSGSYHESDSSSDVSEFFIRKNLKKSKQKISV